MDYKWWPQVFAGKKPEELHPDTLRFIKAVGDFIEATMDHEGQEQTGEAAR